MPTAENAKLQYEAGQQFYAMSALTDSGDQTTFNSSASLWSARTGFTPVIRPDGVITGGVVSAAASATNDAVDITALTANVNGASETNTAETDVTITRPATAVAKINSITYDKSSAAIVVVAGTDSSDTTFSEVRAAAGGPPLIPADAIELAQVRVTSDTAAAIAAAEIFAVVGTHRERYDYPLYDELREEGKICFTAALPSIHTGPLPKTVYASYSAPIFSDIQKATDFVPAENSHSVGSVQIYGGTLGSTSSTLNQSTFTAYLEDGVTDALVSLKDEILWFKHFPDRYKSPYTLTQGKLGIGRTFPAGDQIQATCTISAEAATTNKAA